MTIPMVAAVLALPALPAPSADAAGYKQSTCKREKKAVKKASGKSKRNAKAAHKACRFRLKVYKELKGNRFTSQTGDLTLCGNGKLIRDAGAADETVFEQGWIVDAAMKTRTGWEADIRAKGSTGKFIGYINRRGDGYEAGYVSLSAATKAPAGDLC